MKHRTCWLAMGCIAMTFAFGCNRGRRPHEAGHRNDTPNIHEVIVVDVEQEEIPPAEPAPKPEPTPAPPAQKLVEAPPWSPPGLAPAKPTQTPEASGSPTEAGKQEDRAVSTAKPTPAPKRPARPVPSAAEATDDKEAQATKKALIAFARSVETGKKKQFLDSVAMTPAEKPLIEATWRFIREHAKFEADMKKAYGSTGQAALAKGQQTLVGKTTPTLEELEKGLMVTVAGQTASAQIEGQSNPMNLVRVDGRWKVQLFPPGQIQGQAAEMMVSLMDGLTKTIKQARKNIGKKGYTADRIMEEVNASILSPMEQGK